MSDPYTKGVHDACDGGNGFTPELPHDNTYMAGYFHGYRVGCKRAGEPDNTASYAIQQFWKEQSK